VLKRVVDVVQVVALVCAAVFVVLLFTNEPDDAVASDAGGDVFADRCASCHGAEGEGGQGPRLYDGAVVARFPHVEDQIAVVTDGRGGMPSFATRLTPEQIREVVRYTREDLPG
jgi:mono/diheme cytochrome c family protein